MGLVAGLFRVVWWRWLALGWIGRGLAIAIVIYALGWVAGSAGSDVLAIQFGEAALYVAAFPITALIIRGIWKHSTAHHRR